jgi:REP element-mobilizing transposase RayT
MRKKRSLTQDAWYEVRTVVNNRKSLFRYGWAAALLFRVLHETKALFTFEMRGLRIENERLSFYIKPADGFQLPKIMQWLKQTFAVRLNMRAGRTGHYWGDRYWSEVLEGEPPPGAAEVDWKAVEAAAEPPTAADRRRKRNRDRPHQVGKAAETPFSPEIPLRAASPPA